MKMEGQEQGGSFSRNYKFIQSNLVASVGSSSVVTKSFIAVIILFYFLSFSEIVFGYLSVIPAYLLPPHFWIWTLFTHAFIQPHILLAAVDICVILLSGKLLEPLWGAMQMAMFFGIVTSISAVLTSVVYMFVYYATGNTMYLFDTHIHGLGAYIGGFSVAVKQMMPDHVLLKLPYGKLRNSHIPFVMLLMVIILKIVGLLNGAYPLLFGWGVVVSWIYLRFYQIHSNGSRGDLAENFAFASFFPPPLEGVVSILAIYTFALLVKMKICKKPQRKYDVSSPTTITVTLPGTDPADAERRRQLAIKALNERLSKTKDQEIWPSLDDEEDKADETDNNEPSKTDDVKIDISSNTDSQSQPDTQ